MKKIKFFVLGLAVIALAAVFTSTNAFSPKDALLMENVAALANGWDNPMNPIDGEGGGAIHCLTNSEYNSHANGQNICVRYPDGTKHCRWQNRAMPPLKGQADYDCN